MFLVLALWASNPFFPLKVFPQPEQNPGSPPDPTIGATGAMTAGVWLVWLLDCETGDSENTNSDSNSQVKVRSHCLVLTWEIHYIHIPGTETGLGHWRLLNYFTQFVEKSLVRLFIKRSERQMKLIKWDSFRTWEIRYLWFPWGGRRRHWGGRRRLALIGKQIKEEKK